ncbi:MAG: hypothetical protein FJ039_04310 [Chloroflexi bacterium]|nr:hypothetical protein [Chloroflexota bacterium]
MPPKHPAGVVVVFTDCTSPAHIADYNKWYDEVHVPDILSSGIYYTATRFENAAPKPGDPIYLSLYYTTRSDLDKAYEELRDHDRKIKMTLSPHLLGRYRENYRFIGAKDAGKGRPARVTGLYVEMGRCREPGKEAQAERWYMNTYATALLKTGAFQRVERFERNNPFPGDGRYISFYETTSQDATDAIAKGLARSPRSPLYDVTFARPFRRIGLDRYSAVAVSAGLERA